MADQKVQMVWPDGEPLFVKAENVSTAIQRGARLVQQPNMNREWLRSGINATVPIAAGFGGAAAFPIGAAMGGPAAPLTGTLAATSAAATAGGAMAPVRDWLLQRAGLAPPGDVFANANREAITQGGAELGGRALGGVLSGAGRQLVRSANPGSYGLNKGFRGVKPWDVNIAERVPVGSTPVPRWLSAGPKPGLQEGGQVGNAIAGDVAGQVRTMLGASKSSYDMGALSGGLNDEVRKELGIKHLTPGQEDAVQSVIDDVLHMVGGPSSGGRSRSFTMSASEAHDMKTYLDNMSLGIKGAASEAKALPTTKASEIAYDVLSNRVRNAIRTNVPQYGPTEARLSRLMLMNKALAKEEARRPGIGLPHLLAAGAGAAAGHSVGGAHGAIEGGIAGPILLGMATSPEVRSRAGLALTNPTLQEVAPQIPRALLMLLQQQQDQP